jgi:hypothetical protein
VREEPGELVDIGSIYGSPYGEAGILDANVDNELDPVAALYSTLRDDGIVGNKEFDELLRYLRG